MPRPNPDDLDATPLPRPVDMPRWGVMAVAGLWATCAALLVRLMPTEPFVPWIWPTLFGSTAAALVAVTARPWSDRVHLTATGIGLAALLLRPAALVVRWATRGSTTVEQLAFGSALYILIAVLWFSFCGYSLNTWRLKETVRRAHMQTPEGP